MTEVRNPWDRMWSWFKFCNAGYHNDVARLPNPKQACQLARDVNVEIDGDGASVGSSTLGTVSSGFDRWVRHVLSVKEIGILPNAGDGVWAFASASEWILKKEHDRGRTPSNGDSGGGGGFGGGGGDGSGSERFDSVNEVVKFEDLDDFVVRIAKRVHRPASAVRVINKSGAGGVSAGPGMPRGASRHISERESKINAETISATEDGDARPPLQAVGLSEGKGGYVPVPMLSKATEALMRLHFAYEIERFGYTSARAHEDDGA